MNLALSRVTQRRSVPPRLRPTPGGRQVQGARRVYVKGVRVRWGPSSFRYQGPNSHPGKVAHQEVARCRDHNLELLGLQDGYRRVVPSAPVDPHWGYRPNNQAYPAEYRGEPHTQELSDHNRQKDR